MNEHDNYYDVVCKRRFDEHDVAIDTLDGKVDNILIKLDNGLMSRVKRIDKLIWLIAAVVIGKVVVDLFI